MCLPILKRPQAERDIEECFVFIAEDDLDIGVSFLVAVEDSLEQLSRMPLMGKVKHFPAINNLRIWPVKGFDSYLLFYLANEDSIELVRLLHGARDIDGIFA
jgi:toxin ParE1/3/4